MGAGHSPGDRVVPIEDWLLLPATRVLATWTGLEPVPQPEPALQGRLAELFEALDALFGARARPLSDAALAGDGRAWAALAQLDRVLGAALERLLPRLRQAKLERDWQRLAREAALALPLAGATGRDGDAALAAHLLANAHAGLGDLAGAVRPFRRSIAAAAAAGDVHLQCVGHGNLGNTLRDLGECDAALAEYAAALDLETDARGRALLQANRAVALQRLGERASAVQALLAQAEALQAAAAPAAERVVTLARAAHAQLEGGAVGPALELLDRADALVGADDGAGRAMLAGLRARAAGAQGDRAAADAALQRAWQEALDHAVRQLQPRAPHFAQGFATSLARRLPTAQALQLLLPGVGGKEASDWRQALGRLQAAERQARQAGDLALALRLAANLGATLADAGQMASAQQQLQAVQAEAATRGIARAEATALGTLASIAAQTGELVLGIDVTGLQAWAAALMSLHGQLLDASALPPRDKVFEAMTAEFGSLLNERALIAQRWGSLAQAARLFEQGAELMRPYGPSFVLANRLAGLLDVRRRLHDAAGAQAVAGELQRLLEQLEPRARLVAERALALHLDAVDPAAALRHWQRATALAERLRATFPQGHDASQVNRGFARLPMQCAQRLRRAGREAEAWQVLQQGRARRLLEARAPGQPLPGLAEVQAALQPGEALIDIALEDDGLAAYRVGRDRFDTLFQPLAVESLSAPDSSDLRQREQAQLQLARTDPGLSAWAARVAAGWPARCRLLLVPDGPLHNLPLHEVHLGARAWHESQSIGLLPCAAWLLRAAPVAATRCLVAGNSAADLPGAEAECQAVARMLGVRALTGADCTREALEAALHGGALDIVHLAVHGRGDPLRGGRASLLLADDQGGVAWLPFDELLRQPWRVNLVVLSGCSTGVAAPLLGHELVSLARAALEAGAASVLASLWPVADRAAADLMVHFHTAVAGQRGSGGCDLRLALDDARRASTARAATRVAAGPRRDGRRHAPSDPPQGAPPLLADAAAAFVLLGLPALAAQSPA